ncbi:MAG: phosphoribosylglycinamide formyltransferase [Proteobacteria bacterium]|nr:phosphoribosylglycinamide formyltransferase [Pseudomonadota bacterium]MBU1737379.1 phosphoribosylglycinamide formyltransferase [Pseudomonadota bacterium]
MKMAVLLSGSGRTLDNFHERIVSGTMRGSIEVVISNVAGVLGLEKAEKYGYPAYVAPTSKETNEILAKYDVDLILLAGYLKLYTPPQHLKRAVVNIHPSLIPSFCGDGFYGMRVHRAVKARGVRVSGCTVHFANEVYDEGPIIVQHCVPVFAEDTPDDVAARVFAAECEAYPEAINLVCEKGVDYFWSGEGRRQG